MNNPVILKSISILAFIISALFTIQLMTSGCVGIVATVLTIGMAVVLELSKCGFFYEALSNTKLPTLIRITLAIIAVLLVASSIFASASYVQNQANKTKNKQTKTSSQYKQLEAGKAVQGDLYNVKKKEIDDLKALQEKQQQEGNNIINSMPKDYIDRKNQQRVSTQQNISKIQDTINAKGAELSQIAQNLQTPIDTSTLKLNDDAGYTSMFKAMANMINSNDDYKDSPVKAESLEMWFFIGLGIIFELTAILTAYLAQLKGTSLGVITKNDSTLNGNIGFKPQLVTANLTDSDHIDGPEKVIRPIGFYSGAAAASTRDDKNIDVVESPKSLMTTDFYKPSSDTGIAKEDLKKYIEYVYASPKYLTTGESPGYNPIGKNTGIGVENARKCKAVLERLDIIKTIGTKTFVLMDLQACKEKVQA
ncbi:MAG: hypothetical protein ACD_22C00284G0001 [uncultured bacterium]|nr:MAG: hypothetical protein ACD_22C00284G0001 [uncultured bacterium]